MNASPSPSARRAVRPVAALAALAALLAALAARAAPAHPELRDFQLTGQYVLVVEDETVEGARIYNSDPSSAYLIVSEAFETAVLILPRTGCVETVETAQIVEREDGGLDLAVETTPCKLGKFQLEGANVVFRVQDRAARLEPKPPLVGTWWSSKLVEHTPEYARAARVYRPDAAAIERLARYPGAARVQVFFGTWCSFCTRYIPHALKVEEELKKRGTKVTFEFHGLPPPPAAWATPEATQMQVRRLLTGFVFVDDRLVARVEANDWIRPEVALARHLR